VIVTTKVKIANNRKGKYAGKVENSKKEIMAIRRP